MRTPVHKFVERAKWSYRKNAPDFHGIFFRKYPDFVLSRRPDLAKDSFPVFVFHQVTPEAFEEQLLFLAQNHYVTLNADEYAARLLGEEKGTGREILLTFDDGSVSLWSVAFPLLQKFGMKAVSFILPGLICDSDQTRPTLEDVWGGKIPKENLPLEKNSDPPLCTWREIEKMHVSGVIDFQSHTLFHALVPVSNKIVDFLHPNFDTYYFGNIFVPVYREGERDLFDRTLPLGTPIYQSEPRMSMVPRFFDDEELRKKCQQFVKEEGGIEFFQKKNWRKRLETFFQSTARHLLLKERMETPEEQKQAMFYELHQSKILIEQRLGKTVSHLCYPWFIGSSVAVEQSKKAGYRTNFWGWIPGIRDNKAGQNPYQIVRLEDRFLFRLPGEGRKKLSELLLQKINTYGVPKSMKEKRPE